MRRGETEEPENELGEIVLLEPTGAPGEGWTSCCRVSKNIKKALGKNDADVIMTFPDYQTVLHKAVKVTATRIQFQFGCEAYTLISKRVRPRVETIHV